MSQFEPQEYLSTSHDHCTVVRVYVPEKFMEPGGIGDDLAVACMDAAGGVTGYRARGAWRDPNNSIIAEDVVVLEVLCSTHTSYDRVHAACMEYVRAAKAAGEQAVLITHHKVRGSMY